MESFWQLGDDLRGQLKVSDDHQWSVITSKLAELIVARGERMNHLDPNRILLENKPRERTLLQEENPSKFENPNFQSLSHDLKVNDAIDKMTLKHGMYYGMNTAYTRYNNNNTNLNDNSFKLKTLSSKFMSSNNAKEITNSTTNKVNANNGNGGNLAAVNKNSNNGNANSNATADKRFKTLPSAEMLPRGEPLGGYIFVCNNDTMQEDLKRQLFGLPPRYRDSVRAITPGLPLFLYNYTTHQLHGIFEAVSFGGTNIDPTAWEDKKCKGESRFPAQVRIRVRKLCKALEEDAFRPVLHHYDGPKFRLELSIPETLALLDLCEQADS
ncbi:DCD (Development and Cell Death) domain protein [Wolffia australiana]